MWLRFNEQAYYLCKKKIIINNEAAPAVEDCLSFPDEPDHTVFDPDVLCTSADFKNCVSKGLDDVRSALTSSACETEMAALQELEEMFNALLLLIDLMCLTGF